MCQRKYTDQVVADMQRIAEASKAPAISEAQHQGAADLAQKLREWAADRRRTERQDWRWTDRQLGRLDVLEELSLKIDELAPPVTCDNPPRAGVAGESMQHEIDYCVDTLMCLGPSDLRKVAQQLAADDPSQAERLRKAMALPEGYQRAVILPPVVRPEFHVED